MSFGSFRQDDPSSAWIIHPTFQAKHNEEHNLGKICIIILKLCKLFQKQIWTYLWHQVTWSQRQTSHNDQLDKDQRVCECWLYDSEGKVKMPARPQGHKSLNKCDQNAATRVTCHPGTPGYRKVVTIIHLKVGCKFYNPVQVHCRITQLAYAISFTQKPKTKQIFTGHRNKNEGLQAWRTGERIFESKVEFYTLLLRSHW